MKIGVLAMQGAYREHIDILKKLGVKCSLVRTEDDLRDIDGIIIPGGESTTIGKLLRESGLGEILKYRILLGMPVWGTCAGMIILAKKIEDEEYSHLGIMDIEVRRNAYGKQLGSFNTKSYVKEVAADIEMVFIRAPFIKEAGQGVKVLSVVDENIVAARENNMLVTSFHPELTKDYRLHKYFLNMVKR